MNSKVVSDEPLDLSQFEVCIKCIKGKQINSRKLGAERAKAVLELIQIDICGPFPTFREVSKGFQVVD